MKCNAFTLIEVLITITIIFVLVAIIICCYFQVKQRQNTVTCLSNLRQWNTGIQLYMTDYDQTYPPATEGVFINHLKKNKDNKDNKDWAELIKQIAPEVNKARCPNREVPEQMADYAEDVLTVGYAYNNNLNVQDGIPKHYKINGRDDSVIAFPSLTIAVIEARTGIVSRNKPDIPHNHPVGVFYTTFSSAINEQSPGATRHQGGSNYLFCDGHVKWFRPNQLKTDPKCDGSTPGFGI